MPLLIPLVFGQDEKKIMRPKFDLNQKIISYKLNTMVFLTICMKWFFDKSIIMDSFFFHTKKIRASTPNFDILRFYMILVIQVPLTNKTET